MKDCNSLNESAIPFNKTVFLNKFRVVLMTQSAIDEPSSVNLENCCKILLFKNF